MTDESQEEQLRQWAKYFIRYGFTKEHADVAVGIDPNISLYPDRLFDDILEEEYFRKVRIEQQALAHIASMTYIKLTQGKEDSSINNYLPFTDRERLLMQIERKRLEDEAWEAQFRN